MSKSSRFIISVVLIVLLCGMNVSLGGLVNPSFEAEHDGVIPNGVSTAGKETWGMPDDWAWRKSGNMNAHGIRYDDLVGWSSEGDWSLYVFSSRAGNHGVGDHIEFYQNVDLTGVDTLLFDVYLKGGDYTNTYVAIDSQKLWIRNAAGIVLGASVDISSLTGIHEIEIGVEVFQVFGSSADGWTYFDNLQLVPEPGTMAILVLGGLMLKRRRKI